VYGTDEWIHRYAEPNLQEQVEMFFVTATKSGKLQDEAYTCFLDNVIRAIHEER
jgi:hypothetical protein